MSTKEEKKARIRFAIDTTCTFYVYAEDEAKARKAWEDADFGVAENLDISDVRVAQ